MRLRNQRVYSRRCTRSLLSLSGQAATRTSEDTASSVRNSLHVENGRFVLDGKPLQRISGEMHHERIPRVYWKARPLMVSEYWAGWFDHAGKPLQTKPLAPQVKDLTISRGATRAVCSAQKRSAAAEMQEHIAARA